MGGYGGFRQRRRSLKRERWKVEEDGWLSQVKGNEKPLIGDGEPHHGPSPASSVFEFSDFS